MSSSPSRRDQPSLLGRIGARLERSQHVFLAGLVVAFAVEVVVDWNATFYEVNVLRRALRDKAVHYATMARLAAREPLGARDRDRLRRIAEELRQDDEVSWVRVSGPDGVPLVDEGEPIPARYPHQIERDVRGMLRDPEALRRAIAASRHRDVFQAFTDTQDALVRKLTGAPEPPPPRAEVGVAYQDRIYDEATRGEDRSHTWSLAVVDVAGRSAGVVVIALSTDRLQAGIRKKLYKGLAITVFFLGVILVQQISSRRAKLRMLSMADALAAARSAIASALPSAPPKVEGLAGAVAFEQAERLGGTVYDFHAVRGAPWQLDVFVAMPEGSGVDVAFASLLVRDQQRRLQRELPPSDTAPEPMLRALAAAYAEEPIHRRLRLALLRVDAKAGEVLAVLAGLPAPSVIAGAEEAADSERSHDKGEVAAAAAAGGERIEMAMGIEIERAALDAAIVGKAPIEGPIERVRMALPQGAQLVLYDDGLPPDADHPLGMRDVEDKVRAAPGRTPQEVVDMVRAAAVDRAGALIDDLLVMLLRRM